MKILKKGKKLTTEIKFKCHFCKCEFIVDKGEYRYVYNQDNEIEIYSFNCPTCNCPCVVIKKLKNKK